jgi:hypothetical protein
VTSPFPTIVNNDEIISTIIDALRAVGYPVPSDAKAVSLDSETTPTYIKIDGVKRELSDEDRELVVRAVQLHRVKHRVGNSAR